MQRQPANGSAVEQHRAVARRTRPAMVLSVVLFADAVAAEQTDDLTGIPP